MATRAVYGEGVEFKDESDWSREDVVRMARFRSAPSLELHCYRCRIGLESDGLCRRCGLVTESVEHNQHIVECDAGWWKCDEVGRTYLSDLCCRPGVAQE